MTGQVATTGVLSWRTTTDGIPLANSIVWVMLVDIFSTCHVRILKRWFHVWWTAKGSRFPLGQAAWISL